MAEAYEFVIATTHAKIASSGFRRSGAILRLTMKDTCGVVQFQKSLSSDRSHIKFTVNASVVLKALLDPRQPELKKSRSVDGHVLSRIGDFLPGRPDIWWELRESTNLAEVADEVASAVYDLAVPFIKRYLEVCAVIALWSSGDSPGITSLQCEKYLARLTSSV